MPPDLGPDHDDRILTGWGRTMPARARVVRLATGEEVSGAIALSRPLVDERGMIARGLGRSYNDAAQNGGGVVVTLAGSDTGITVDAGRGTATVRAGTSIGELIDHLLPLGWFVPVTPGTRHVTLGGAVAADVHGKNHHRDGSIGAHVVRLTLDAPIGRHVLSPTQDPDAFWATVGGLGLTGVVRDVTLRLLPVSSALVRVHTRRVPDLGALVDVLLGDEARYSVAWVDATATGRHLGRSVVTSAEHATADDARHARHARHARRRRGAARAEAPRWSLAVPPLPIGVVGPSVTRAWNEAWFRRAPVDRAGELQPVTSYFHPLDGVAAWNRLYGPRGLVQWQCAVPLEAASVLTSALETLARHRLVSPLVVLKRFGAATPGPLSFPLPGWTLAVDLPAGADGVGPVLDRLDEAVADAGGRLYLAKDGRMRPELVPVMYPRLAEWRATRDRLDPDRVLRSDLARRLDLLGDAPRRRVPASLDGRVHAPIGARA